MANTIVEKCSLGKLDIPLLVCALLAWNAQVATAFPPVEAPFVVSMGFPCGNNPSIQCNPNVSPIGYQIQCGPATTPYCQRDTGLSVDYVYLVGQLVATTIPSEAALLTALTLLNLNGNPAISGTLPAAYGNGNLTKLRVVLLHNNLKVSGTLPDAYGELTALETLRLHNNLKVSGTLPDAYGKLAALNDLYLGGNKAVTGTLPAAYGNGNLTKLRVL
jgi:hypothetical protein